MTTICKALLLLGYLWHFGMHMQRQTDALQLPETTTTAAIYFNDSNTYRQQYNNAATVQAYISSTTPPSNLDSSQTISSTRQRRQLFWDPNLLLLANYGTEGGKCFTTRGIAGVCVRQSACQPYYRYKRQLTFYALRQWAQSLAPLGQEVCTFYDQFGRANSGVCCTNTDNAFDVLPSFSIPGTVKPIPSPPTEETPILPPAANTTQQMDHVDNAAHAADDASEVVNAATLLPDDVHHTSTSPTFHDEDNVIYDAVKDEDEKPIPPPTAVSTYNDFRYQWPTQFAGHFGTGTQQWPPPLPTHPPSAANWPPPIPTHPPNHHYPTHPPSSSATRPTNAPLTTVTTRRPVAVTTTRRPLTTTTRRATTTTTRRSSYPSYPGFPGFPSYPSYPTQRPPTHAPTTTTTRAPAASPPVGASSLLPQQCGIKNPVSPDQERIVGGTNASPYEFPWIAVLFRSGKQFCGGSLITHNHILTAAHCVARMTSWDVAALTAHLGDYNIRTDFETKHVARRIKRLVRHKGFDFSTLHNDIAILTISEPVKFTYEIQPICLPTSTFQQGRSYSGHVAIVAGWGSLRENGPQPSVLQKVQIPIWSNNDCARKYGRAAPGGIIESMICAGQASKDSCSGDSGGPLIVHEGGRYTQVGIVSWGIGCGKGEYPGVYTRVTSLLPWIYKNIK